MRRKKTNKRKESERRWQISERKPADELRASGRENRTVSRHAAISKSCGSIKETCRYLSFQGVGVVQAVQRVLYGMEDPGFVSSRFCTFLNWAAEREIWVYSITVVGLLLLVARSQKVPSWHLKFPTNSWAGNCGSTITVEGALYLAPLQTARQTVCSQNTFPAHRKGRTSNYVVPKYVSSPP